MKRAWQQFGLVFAQGGGDGQTSVSASIELRDLLDDEVWDDFTKKRKLEKAIATLEENGIEHLSAELVQRGLVNLFKEQGVVDEEDEDEMLAALLAKIKSQ